MKLVKSLLLGSATGLATVGAVQAADLPVRKAAPVEYVRVCDAYGAGFFYIPGSDTCLRVGGLVLAQFGIQPPTSNNVTVLLGSGTPVGNLGGAVGIPVAGVLPATTGYRSQYSRDTFGFTATGRLELDARTQSPYGTVRSFIRVDTNFGSGAQYGTTGSLGSSVGLGAFNTTGGPSISRELAFLSKGFIQFAGITAGRVQSFFDFYADAINYAGLYGSNQTVLAAAYTYTAGGGWSITGAFEDAGSHRGNVASVINVANVGALNAAGLVGGNGVAAANAPARMPDIVGNVRWDQPWGSFQLSASLHQIRTNLFAAGALNAGVAGAPAFYANPATSSTQFGFAVQGGAQFNMDMISPGDKLWLQATYARGAIGYLQGNNLAFVGGINGTTAYGVGISRTTNGVGYAGGYQDVDCVYNYSGTCDKSRAFSLLAAYKHYWTPTISSGFFGNYYQVTYSTNSQYPINPFNNAVAGGGAAAGAGSLFTLGYTNFRQTRLGANLVWTPVKNFDIGAELTWAHYMQPRPFGLAPDAVLTAVGLPKFRSTDEQFLGAVRVIRAF